MCLWWSSQRRLTSPLSRASSGQARGPHGADRAVSQGTRKALPWTGLPSLQQSGPDVRPGQAIGEWDAYCKEWQGAWIQGGIFLQVGQGNLRSHTLKHPRWRCILMIAILRAAVSILYARSSCPVLFSPNSTLYTGSATSNNDKTKPHPPVLSLQLSGPWFSPYKSGIRLRNSQGGVRSPQDKISVWKHTAPGWWWEEPQRLQHCKMPTSLSSGGHRSRAHGREKTGYCLCFHSWVNTVNPWGWKARMTLFPLNEDGESKWIVGKGKKRETPPCYQGRKQSILKANWQLLTPSSPFINGVMDTLVMSFC